MLVDGNGDMEKGTRQAQANANSSGVPWIVWMYPNGTRLNVFCDPATESDMCGTSGRVLNGGKVIEPEGV